MRRLRRWLMHWILASAVGLAAAGPARPARADDPDGLLYTGCTPQTAPLANAGFEQQVVELVNQERLNNGNLPPLKRVDELDSAARFHAEDMRVDNYHEHDSYDRSGGNLVEVCAWNTRVGNFYGSGVRGENIAWGYASPASVMNGWMNSSGHRANILNSSHREIGVGYAGGNNWVQDFGAKSGRYPLVINRDAAQTSTRGVSVYIYRGSGSAAWTHMRLKNDTDADYGAWQPFQNSFAWTLGAGSGVRTVTAQLSSNSGTSVGATSSDTILLNLVNQMAALPATLTFLYDLSTSQVSPSTATLALVNTAGGDTLNWAALQQGSWFTLSPAAGTTPAALTITPVTFGQTPQVFTGVVTVTVTSPAGTDNALQHVDVRLVVSAQVLPLYLPLVRH